MSRITYVGVTDMLNRTVTTEKQKHTSEKLILVQTWGFCKFERNEMKS